MKNLLYVIAGLLMVIWAIVLFGFNSITINSFKLVHLLLIFAVFIVLIRLIFSKTLSNNYNNKPKK
ncbi:MAG: hypothetical protein A2W91_08270 [Bacteroidetes bacterium GWF2_38_335]|nr:MAG: hypothetical protein A2W91_08270 [Bacteroidetes bacterium GWF2_38_335]OFY78960.1 MAG: hypothetical protein A2281_02450 [Bacteroidetes bacterium RIFOXYA12_FULL_38_20]HBS86031.1 hypothetical protein [Bacteroidales bacterium]